MVIVEIPVLSAPGMDQVRLDFALTPEGGSRPPETSMLWIPVASVDVAGLPTSVFTPPIATPTRFWHRLAGFVDGVRATHWSEPASILLEGRPRFATTDLLAGPGPTQRVTWAPSSLTAGVRIRWAVHEDGETPSFPSSADRDAEDEEHEFSATVPIGRVLTVELQAWSDFTGGSVDGDLGEVLQLAWKRRETITDQIASAAIGCRLVLTSDLGLIFTNDLCLVVTEPEN